MEEINLIARWGHLVFGIAWIGMLYYSNFVQGGYFKSASPEALADAKAKLAPSALWWFRWGAMFTFLTGLYLLHVISATLKFNEYIIVGAAMGILMFLNVWLVIWPNQKVALGMKEGDGPAAAAKALLASRTNTLFSAPMAYFMVASAHKAQNPADGLTNGLWISLAIIILLEINALMGKQGPLTSVAGVIHCSLALTLVLGLVLHFM